MHFSTSNPMFDHLLETSHRDDSYKWSNIGFGEGSTQVESIVVKFTHTILSSVDISLVHVNVNFTILSHNL